MPANYDDSYFLAFLVKLVDVAAAALFHYLPFATEGIDEAHDICKNCEKYY